MFQKSEDGVMNSAKAPISSCEQHMPAKPTFRTDEMNAAAFNNPSLNNISGVRGRIHTKVLVGIHHQMHQETSRGLDD